MNKHEAPVLAAIHILGSPTPSQLSRFLFDSGLETEFDLLGVLSSLCAAKLLEQGVSSGGITYSLTGAGQAQMETAKGELGDEALGRYEDAGREYRDIFEREKDYIALYTEQANGIFPLFLSIRRKEKILMQVNIIVQNETAAKAITKSWMEHAHSTYDAVWDSISEGLALDKPEFQ